MTRINTQPPQELVDKHLQAEHYEMIRVPNAVRKDKAVVKNIPETFRLGTGHVKFFYDKLGYLQKRYHAVHEECLRRGMNVTDFSDSFDGIPEHLMNDWQPTEADIKISRERIAERLKTMKNTNKSDYVR